MARTPRAAAGVGAEILDAAFWASHFVEDAPRGRESWPVDTRHIDDVLTACKGRQNVCGSRVWRMKPDLDVSGAEPGESLEGMNLPVRLSASDAGEADLDLAIVIGLVGDDDGGGAVEVKGLCGNGA